MADQFLGEIRIVPFNFPPNGWAQCDGQILPISQNTALFSLLGVQFGGNGTTNFGLPNLQNSVAVDYGSGVGLSQRSMGETGGASTVTLTDNQMPAHTHGVNASTSTATKNSPQGNVFAVPVPGPRRPGQFYTTGSPDSSLQYAGLQAAGGSAAHNNLQPYLRLNFIISLTGIFPARN